ncbi:OmpA family protein [Reichenbachiella sp. MALMAid0571]|uniref:OmpA family protein n=1 Tax=Reichenbachiella sp. MALMAid0571 TaxID=3143939 RepID=UPI0032DF4472
MKFIWVLLFSIATFFSFAQNLVFNPDFEVYENCPDKFTVNFTKIIIPHWESPTGGTPDYYNSCSEGLAGVPKNWAGDCSPKSGDGYVGIYLWKVGGFREYLQGKLTTSLEKGETYKIQFYVSQSLNAEYFIQNIGLVLTSKPIKSQRNIYKKEISVESTRIDRLHPNIISKKPISTQKYDHFINPEMGNYLEAKLSVNISEMKEWELVEWTYTASGGEQYIIIGNFLSQNETILKKAEFRLYEEPMLNRSAYVLIDDVSVIPVNEKGENPEQEFEEPVVVLSDVNFAFNSYFLTLTGYNFMDSLLATLKNDMKEYQLKIVGHTDNAGTERYNKNLGRKRAQSVANYFISNDFQKESIAVESMGESMPLDSNETEAGRKRNRRVEIHFIPLSTED